MKNVSRTQAQALADSIEIFHQELKRLEHEEVLRLTPAQMAAVEDHHQDLLRSLSQEHDIDPDQRSRQLSWGMRIVSFLGALALSASVFFLFFQFWGLFSTVMQVTILITASLATLGATFYIESKDASGYFTKLAAMVAFVCFVLNIVMLGQRVNITPSAKVFLAWAALALLLAYTFDQKLLLVAGILCIAGFISARTGTFSGMYWLHFGERPENFLPAALLIFGVPLVINHQRFTGFASMYRVFGLLLLFLPLLVLSNWGRASYLALDPDLIEGVYQVSGFILSGAFIWLGIRRGWPRVVNTAMTFLVIFLYTKFYDWWWEIMPKYLFFLVLGLTAILFLLVLRRIRFAGELQPGEVRA